MLTAILAPIGAVIVALIAYVATRIDRADLRKRLRSDVEVIEKLQETSPIRIALERNGLWLVEQIVVEDRDRVANRKLGWRVFWIAFLAGTSSGLRYAIVHADLGEFRGTVLFAYFASIAALGGLTLYVVVDAITTAIRNKRSEDDSEDEEPVGSRRRGWGRRSRAS